IHIILDKNGWASVEDLIKNANHYGQIRLTPKILKQIVETNDKKRFSFNEDYSKIRANQGHSIPIDLGYTPTLPPAVLYHGTAEKYVQNILQQGLCKMDRHHVHLSIDIETAIKVGQRHGKPIVFEVASDKMHVDNHVFYKSENGVWLTMHIPSKYLKIIDLI
nr:RNA 2'-phosphotransferase [Chitinophagaceae bacterium]